MRVAGDEASSRRPLNELASRLDPERFWSVRRPLLATPARPPLRRAKLRAVELASAVVSVTRTQRGRYFWAAWWTGAPCASPFRKPDAAHGGARSEAEALAEAERAAARHLTPIEPYWARAFTRVLRGEPPPPRKLPGAARPLDAPTRPPSAHAVLGVAPGASAQEIRAAYKRKALLTHPDQGGSDEAFRAVQRAYERLTPPKRRR